MDRFSQLVEDLTNGDLTLIQIQIAIRASIRRDKNIPDGIKDLLAGREASAGLIYRMFKPIQEVIGAMELAYRRGSQTEDYILTENGGKNGIKSKTKAK